MTIKGYTSTQNRVPGHITARQSKPRVDLLGKIHDTHVTSTCYTVHIFFISKIIRTECPLTPNMTISEEEHKAFVKKAAKAKSDHPTKCPRGNVSGNFNARGEY